MLKVLLKQLLSLILCANLCQRRNIPSSLSISPWSVDFGGEMRGRLKWGWPDIVTWGGREGRGGLGLGASGGRIWCELWPNIALCKYRVKRLKLSQIRWEISHGMKSWSKCTSNASRGFQGEDAHLGFILMSELFILYMFSVTKVVQDLRSRVTSYVLDKFTFIDWFISKLLCPFIQSSKKGTLYSYLIFVLFFHGLNC